MGDHEYMQLALRLAARGLTTTDPNPRVGCVLVKADSVVGEGWHERAGLPHAEINALQDAGEQAGGATAYVTLEPCSHHGRTPPCADALIDAGVARVVIAMQDPNPRVAGQGIARLKAAGIEVQPGLLAAQAADLNPGFIKRMRDGRPLIRIKTAMSLDGRTAMASGESKWISGEQSRHEVQRWRARSSAILTGIGTVLADDPSMNVRLTEAVPEGGWRQPLRIVLDGQLRMPVTARMLALPGTTHVMTVSDSVEKIAALEAAGATVSVLPAKNSKMDLLALMQALCELEINEVLVEAGATLNGSLLDQDLVDELIVYLAPHVMGDAARGVFHLPGLEHMSARKALKITDVHRVGDDLCIQARPANSDAGD
ncbi:MAG TPA: bifunctional diaminohydroxyphosphoribosylaminopyrimidine deaminase/5-amino-6-(5-phosphoribosylamino)uracil reductase RibD [Gammaproteobacteria bacterium]|nr:bifunctional diaminohydroxyphosphoribosylaminopyrimidine deaminase/5-amino-6-(5-phosphoribosylamino)uracil reductase RibD [Gammaproteobacteria bacterium]